MEVIDGRRNARACFAAVIRTIGNAVHLKTRAIMLLENARDA
jgi:hypothetical protein